MVVKVEKNFRNSSKTGTSNWIDRSQRKLALWTVLFTSTAFFENDFVSGFQPPYSSSTRVSRKIHYFNLDGPSTSSTARYVLEMEKLENDELNQQEAKKKQSKQSDINLDDIIGDQEPPKNSVKLDPSTYEAMLINSWDVNPTSQKGFDWEIEKMRRNFAGLQQLDDGSWIRRPSLFDFLVNKSRFSTATVRRLDEPPKPVNLFDVLVLFTTNLLANIGFGPSLGMAAVPDAVIQKYEGSFFSFIKGALGGDLQTLAGGPLFLLLAKYYQDYGPIFNLSFGPKSFLVVSDPVMARHILRESSPEQYCKGMLSEILEVRKMIYSFLCLCVYLNYYLVRFSLHFF